MSGFDEWNSLKKTLEGRAAATDRFPKEGEVWICILGKNVGFEQNGSGTDFVRPVLILKKFNNHMFWTVPLTTKQKAFDFYFNFNDIHGNPVAAILAQLRLLSVKRLERKLNSMPNAAFSSIRERLQSLL